MVSFRPSSSNAPAAMGVDVGGHGVRGVLVNGRGTVLASEQLPLQGEVERTVEVVEDKVCELVGRLGGLADALVAADAPGTPGLPVGIGIPGFQDRQEGVIRSSPNFPEWVDLPVARRLSDRIGVAVTVENDANCSLLGEYWTGAARDVDNVVLLTLGTGVGTGFLVNGALVRGAKGAGAEGGHMILHPGGRSCGCGQDGCLEAYVSGPSLVRTAREAWASRSGHSSTAPATAKELFQLVAQGSSPARETIDRWCDDLARGIASLVHIFAPGAVVLAGGLCTEFDLFHGQLEDAVVQHSIPACLEGVLPLRRAELGSLAGAVGAAFAALEARESLRVEELSQTDPQSSL